MKGRKGWVGSHYNCASREGLVRWIKQSGFELGRFKKAEKSFLQDTEVLPTTLSCLHLIAKGRCLHLLCCSESCNKPIMVQTLPLHTGTGAELGPPPCLSALLIRDSVHLGLFTVSANSKTWPGGSKSIKLVSSLGR